MSDGPGNVFERNKTDKLFPIRESSANSTDFDMTTSPTRAADGHLAEVHFEAECGQPGDVLLNACQVAARGDGSKAEEERRGESEAGGGRQEVRDARLEVPNLLLDRVVIVHTHTHTLTLAPRNHCTFRRCNSHTRDGCASGRGGHG